MNWCLVTEARSPFSDYRAQGSSPLFSPAVFGTCSIGGRMVGRTRHYLLKVLGRVLALSNGVLLDSVQIAPAFTTCPAIPGG